MRVNQNAATVDLFHASGTVGGYVVSGDVELESKPTWAY